MSNKGLLLILFVFFIGILSIFIFNQPFDDDNYRSLQISNNQYE